jgi:dTDP-4-dehydrorhamnose 3,5-epimerase
MRVVETELKDVYLLEPKVFKDERGYFYESYNEKLFTEYGFAMRFLQDNESMSSYGVIRGLHYQLAPFAQCKLIRAIQGTIYDVVVDLRENSPTYGKWAGFEISAESKLQLLIPQGFAHGFSVLSEVAVFSYKCDNFYHAPAERGILYNDPSLGIDWKIPAERVIVSVKDRVLPEFAKAERNFIYHSSH